MKVAIVYTSVTGNTEQLAQMLVDSFNEQQCPVSLYNVHEFPVERIKEFDVFIVGTYTWGNGEIPSSMEQLYSRLEEIELPNLVTGVFGTGDSFFPHYCGAVDRFRDVLKNNTNLAVTLKVELFPQSKDQEKCVKFVDKCLMRFTTLTLG